MKFINFFLVFLINISVVFAAETIEKKPLIITSINPIYQIVLAITKDKDNSILIIDPKTSEHDYQLKKADINFISKADLIFYIDDELEKNFAKLVRNKKSYKLSQVNGIKLLQLRTNPKKNDPHLWLNPQNAIIIAKFISKKLCEIDQINAKKYQQNLQKFSDEIISDEKIISQKLSALKSFNYIFYHDGYQYFEDYFSLKSSKIIANNHDYELTIKDLRQFDSLARNQQVKCIFGDIYDQKNSAKKLALNYKINFVALDLIGDKATSYKNLLLQIAENMASCLNKN
ncbi:MAG: metal ABC transporter substrate-binding protein [Rickettsiales bacterium]|nr:metal ABC transporter substrate-binding protein [Rickettsiales bacterium]